MAHTHTCTHPTLSALNWHSKLLHWRNFNFSFLMCADAHFSAFLRYDQCAINSEENWKRVLGIREMVQWVIFFLHKHEDVNLKTQPPWGKPDM